MDTELTHSMTQRHQRTAGKKRQAKRIAARFKGVTLIEILVAIAIVAILGAIALPIYTNQAQKARRADAKAALTSIALAQERYYTLNSEYADSIETLVSDGGLDSKYNLDTPAATGQSDYYALSINAEDTQTFTVTAVASSTKEQSEDTDCKTFSIDQTGAFAALNSDDDDNSEKCW